MIWVPSTGSMRIAQCDGFTGCALSLILRVLCGVSSLCMLWWPLWILWIPVLKILTLISKLFYLLSVDPPRYSMVSNFESLVSILSTFSFSMAESYFSLFHFLLISLFHFILLLFFAFLLPIFFAPLLSSFMYPVIFYSTLHLFSVPIFFFVLPIFVFQFIFVFVMIKLILFVRLEYYFHPLILTDQF